MVCVKTLLPCLDGSTPSRLTLGDFFYTLPWCVGKTQAPESYFDMWMVPLDSIEGFDRFSEG